jgi:hypothetical protein
MVSSIYDYNYAYNKPAAINAGVSSIDDQIAKLTQKNNEIIAL